jgi:hypothetical protein
MSGKARKITLAEKQKRELKNLDDRQFAGNV